MKCDDEELASRAFEQAAQLVKGQLERVKDERVRCSIKCVLVPARVGDEPVMIKSVFAKPALWRWYLTREAELYRSLLLPRAPKLYAATDSLMVRTRFVGRVLAEKRHEEMTDEASWREVHELLRSVSSLKIDPPRIARDEVSSKMMRQRLLEDPDSPVSWVVEGFDRAAMLQILTREDAEKLKSAAMSDNEQSFAHGDLLLRNIVRSDHGLSLIDWECAGIYLRGWDAALVSVWSPSWFQDALSKEDPSPRFTALRAWALVREINYRLKKPDSDKLKQRLKSKLATILASLKN